MIAARAKAVDEHHGRAFSACRSEAQKALAAEELHALQHRQPARLATAKLAECQVEPACR